MRTLKTSVLIISSFIAMIFIMQSCKNKYAVEVAAIDSLIAKNKKTMDYIQIDLITINERRTEMKGQIAVLNQIKPDTSGLEFTMNLDKYKGIFKVYTRFIENYDVIFNKVRLNEKQLSTLKNSVIDEKISGSDFKLAMNKEKAAIEDNLINAQTFGGRISQLEPDYQRLSSYFDTQIEGLIKQFPELKKVLDENSK
jgi:hypothetical protein